MGARRAGGSVEHVSGFTGEAGGIAGGVASEAGWVAGEGGDVRGVVVEARIRFTALGGVVEVSI